MPAPPCPLRVSEYQVSLDVDFAQLRWKGTADFEVQGTAEAIDLDSVRLTIEAAAVDGTPVTPEVDAERGRLRLKSPVHGSAQVHVAFSGGVVEHSLMGLYRSRYGSTYILTTQCEPDAARQLFPCIDRPDVKARIVLTVVTDATLEVISNTPAESAAEGNRRRWTFAPTPPMPTYLLYLGIGIFDHLDDRSGPIAFSVLTPTGRHAEGTRALEVTRIALAELEKYYRIPYPLPKLDLIAVPEFPAGAMENWGAITFRDMQLLVTDKTPAFEMRYTVATIVHELAHQWFGNLVTPYWWTDIWLNESFATFVEHKVVERRFPELKSEQDFLSIWTQWGFLLDSVPSSHPIVVDVSDPKDVGQAIDRLTYGKGASVLRMVEGYLGGERFQAGVADYIRRHAMGNASSGDLWQALDRASGEPITKILRPWIERPGHPVVSVRSTPQGLHLSQRRFGYLPPANDDPWPIPMVIEVGGTTQRILFDTREREVSGPADTTVHLNPGAIGFYRTLYEPALYDRLLTGFAQRPPADRWIVLEDLWGLLLSGDVPFATYARFVRAIDHATDYVSIGATANHLETLYGWAGQHAPVAELARSFLATQFERMGLSARPGEDSLDGSSRGVVVRARVAVDPGFARQLSEEFGHYDRLDPNVRWAVAVAHARTEGARAYDELKRALARASTESEGLRLEIALAWISDPKLVERTLDEGFAGGVNLGHFTQVLLAASTNPVARKATWGWLERRFPEVQQRLHATSLLQDFLDLALPYLGLSQPAEVRRYFRDHPFPGDDKAIERGLAMLEVAERLSQRLAKSG